MRFLMDAEQRAFSASLDAMLTAADTPAVIRDWSRGDHVRGRALWARVAEAGVFALAVPETHEGLGLRPVELTLAFVELGRHAAPGPLVETAAAAALLAGLDDPGPAKRLLPALASGESTATLATGPYALDADVADIRLTLSTPVQGSRGRSPLGAGSKGRQPLEDGTGRGGGGEENPTELRLAPPPGSPHPTLDPARRLFETPRGGEL
ncbi:acyl-CoA dehydrogenase family protein, partial [Streptomyces sp. WM6386]|uniref:acyl-CoA dehydrogenase family protein n=1 Tax=Streptomyces sp. WM6386 TaxID=1415558 RepID=UPI000619DB67